LYKVYPEGNVTTYSVSLLLNDDKEELIYCIRSIRHHGYYLFHRIHVQLFESGCYLSSRRGQ